MALALALSQDPQVVILDEPTAGLDVASRVELHRLIRELREAGRTVLIATHDMAEAKDVTDRVAILLRGRVVATGTPRRLTATGSGYTKVSVRSERGTLTAEGEPLPGVAQSSGGDGYSVFFTTQIGPTVSAILARLEAAADPLVDLRVERPSLEERFLELTGGAG